jgi:glycosyltransferase involved in cell wall biosynthesis
MSTTAAPDLVSVVVPCHNAEPYVAETLESILAQTHPAVETIVVDDASTDGSWDVVRRFADRYPEQVRALRLEANRGGGYARNRGAELAGGGYLMFLDADDFIAPDALGTLVSAVRDVPGAIAAGDSCKVQRNEAGEWVRGGRDARLPPDDTEGTLRGWLDGSVWVPTCALLWRRDAYEATGGWDESLARNQDGDIAMRALVGGAPMVVTPKMVGFYRMHGDARVSVSRNFVHLEKLRSQLKVTDRIASLLREQGRLEAFAPSLAADYSGVALRAFQAGHWEFGRECVRQARRVGHGRMQSDTRMGRVLERVLGLEGKERVVQALARMGIMSPGRRTIAGLRAHAAGDAS